MDRDPPSPPPGRVIIQHWLQVYVAEIIQIPVHEVDITLPFSYFGLDSVAAFGIAAEMEIWLRRKLSPTLTWDHANIEQLSAFLAEGK